MDHFFRYEATCTNCNHVVKSADDTKWLDPFFLPRHCPNCGEYRSDIWFSKGYETVQVRYDLVKKPFVWWRPSTWFGDWVKSHPARQSLKDASE